MAALTDTLVYHGEFGGKYRLHVVTGTLTSASDTIVFTAADGFDQIDAIISCNLTGGMDAALMTLQPSYSSLTVTIVSKGEDGAAATNWDSATFTLVLLVSGES